MRKFTAHVLTRDGTWSQKVMSGPQSYSQWEAAWNVFAICMIMLDIASPGSLQQYQRGIRRLHSLYLGDWATIASLDEEMRCEQWNQLYQELAAAPPGQSSASFLTSPWNYIISSTRSDYLAGPRADWWRGREIILERAIRSKPLPNIHDSVVPPGLPSWQGQRVIPELAGNTASSSTVAPRAVADSENISIKKKKRKSKAAKQAQTTGKGQGRGEKVARRTRRATSVAAPTISREIALRTPTTSRRRNRRRRTPIRAKPLRSEGARAVARFGVLRQP